MEYLLPTVFLVLLIFFPIRFKFNAYFTDGLLHLYLDVRLYNLKVYRRKVFIVEKNAVYFKKNKQYDVDIAPLVGGTVKASPTKAIKEIGEIRLDMQIFLSTKEPFLGAVGLSAVVAATSAVCSLVGISFQQGLALAVGEPRLYSEIKIGIKTDIVKIILVLIKILFKTEKTND